MNKILSLAAFLILFSVGASYADMHCQMEGDGSHDGAEMEEHEHMLGGGMGMHGILQFQKDLNLTSDQVSSIQKIRTDAAKDMIHRQADIKANRLDIVNALHQENPDFAAARKSLKQISDLELQQKSAFIDAMEKTYGVLTKEQKTKLPQLMMQRKEMMQGMKHEGEGK
jgi:Spy/CpxP family protein refolding chaperone